MKRIIYNTFNIEKGEGLSVFLLIIQSFFLGVFFQSFEISSTALFMESYGEEMIGKAYLVSGIVGIVLTALYSKLQRNISFSKLAALNLLFITAVTFFIWYGINQNSDPRLIFASFIMMGPLYVLSFVGFSGMAGRLFTLRQGKRLFGIVDSGLIFGFIVISFSISYLLNVIPETKDLILISAASVFISLLFQFVISFKFNLNSKVESEEESTEPEKVDKASIKVFFSNKYIRLTSLFAMLAMIATFFISCSFLVVTKINYPDTKEYAGFLGKFISAVMVFSLIIKAFVYSRLMKTYGLKVVLMILPALLLVFTLVTSVSGTFFGYEKDTTSFLIFFLLISLVRFFSINLKDSIQTPSVRLLFQPIDAKIRFDVQAKVEGVINELSAVIAGGALAVLATLKFIEIIHYSYFLIGIIVAWTYITVRLYLEYQNTLKESLSAYKSAKTTKGSFKEESNEIASGSENNLYELELLQKIQPKEYQKRIIELTRSKLQQHRIHALKSISKYTFIEAHDAVKGLLKKELASDIKKLAQETENKLKEAQQLQQEQTGLEKLAKSNNPSEREKAVKIIASSNNAAYLPILKSLLKDINPSVKSACLLAAAKSAYKDAWPILIDHLESSQYHISAKSALLELGEDSFDLLEKSFFRSGILPETMVAITNIIGHIKSEKSTQFLLDKITYSDRNIAYEALNGLHRMDYKAENEDNVNKILQVTEKTIKVIAWNLSIMHDLKKAEHGEILNEAMEEELKQNFELLFTLLSLAYDKMSIQHIRENIESGRTEAINFAIEMLDLFVAESLKPILFPVLEDNRIEDKIKELELHFPINRNDRIEVLHQLINRSSNNINRYTKACAIYAIQDEDGEVSDELVANLFHPDQLLRETAAVVIHKLDPKKYAVCAERLKEEVKEKLNHTISILESRTSHLLIEKAFSIKNNPTFKHLKSNTILSLAYACSEEYKERDEILFDMNTSSEDRHWYLINQGAIKFQLDDKSILSFKKGDFVSDAITFENDKNAKAMAAEKSSFYKISKKDLYNIMFKNPELITILTTLMNKRFENNPVKTQ